MLSAVWQADLRSFSLRQMNKCFIQIGVQNPTTKNAFSEAQKFIIISVISKGFSSCFASEFSSTHLSLSTEQDLKDYSEHGKNWLKRQISICKLNHHFEFQMYFLFLVIAYNSDSQPWSYKCSSEITKKSSRLKSTFQPLVNTQGSVKGGAKARFRNLEKPNVY